jgi:hypothetical protein
MPKTVFVDKREHEELLGTFLNDSHYETLIDDDIDVYVRDRFGNESIDEDNVVLKFRKNWFTKEQQEGAYEGLKDAAVQSQNRGLAAGPKGEKCLNRDWVTPEQSLFLKFLEKVTSKPTEEDVAFIKSSASVTEDTRGLVWLGSEKEKHNFDWVVWINKVVSGGMTLDDIKKDVNWINDELISDTTYANPVDSGIAGWFGRYPRIPYGRATAYTNHNRQKFELCYPFMQQLSLGFEQLLPQRFSNQMAETEKLDPNFYIPGTPFTTITVNRNFRTAAHRDAGDLAKGFSNLTVVAKDKNYEGSYLVLPEARAAVNIRPGDLLLVGNHDWIHGNTPILAPNVGDLERISLVCYFREDMLDLGSKEYEDQRFNYVETRRKNQSHPLWWSRWNGVSNGMWGEEWFNFLRENNKENLITKYHPETTIENNSLEDFFT